MKIAAFGLGLVFVAFAVAVGCDGGDSPSGDPGSGGAGGIPGHGASGAGGDPGSGASDATGGAPGAGGEGPSSSSSRQTAHPLGGGNTAPNGFYEYLPPGYDGSSETPLLVFWHGIGEDGNGGSELFKVLANGPPSIVQANLWPDSRPFIVLSPQYVPANGEIAPGGGCPSSAVIHAFLTWALANYNVDAKRVYLTGLSCGAIGSWDYLADHRGSTVAAAVLIAGNPGDPAAAGSAWKRAGCELGEAAIWSLHGDLDGIVPYAPDHDTMEKLIACPSPPRRNAMFTDIEGADHGIWGAIYSLDGGEGDIYQWMLNNAKP